jgi:hypothetical protein
MVSSASRYHSLVRSFLPSLVRSPTDRSFIRSSVHAFVRSVVHFLCVLGVCVQKKKCRYLHNVFTHPVGSYEAFEFMVSQFKMKACTQQDSANHRRDLCADYHEGHVDQRRTCVTAYSDGPVCACDDAAACPYPHTTMEKLYHPECYGRNSCFKQDCSSLLCGKIFSLLLATCSSI